MTTWYTIRSAPDNEFLFVCLDAEFNASGRASGNFIPNVAYRKGNKWYLSEHDESIGMPWSGLAWTHWARLPSSPSGRPWVPVKDGKVVEQDFVDIEEIEDEQDFVDIEEIEDEEDDDI